MRQHTNRKPPRDYSELSWRAGQQSESCHTVESNTADDTERSKRETERERETDIQRMRVRERERNRETNKVRKKE